MTRLRRSIFSDLLVIGALAAPVAADDVPRILIDRSLDEQIVDFAGLDGANLLVSDERGQIASLDRRRFVGFVAREPAQRYSIGAGVLELIDGQRLVGTLVPGDGDGALVWWNHTALGTLRVPLERIADIVLAENIKGVPSSTEILEDVVILVNGDRITGFVEQVGSLVMIDDGEALREIDVNGVGAIVLANPIRGMDGAYVWLADASVVSIRHAQNTEEGRVQLTASLGATEEETIAESGIGEVDVADILALVFDAGDLVGLGRLEPEGFQRDASRRWSESPTIKPASTALLGASEIVIPGPMSVWWELPDGAVRLAFIAELPSAMRTWGDCELIVETGREGMWSEIVREPLTGDRPEVRVNIPIAGEGPLLRFTLDEGRYGPIQDRVVIKRAVLLIED